MRIALDFAFDAGTVHDAIAETLAVAGLAHADVAPRVVGRANGWPVVAFEGTPDALLALVRTYDDDVHATLDDLAAYAAPDA